MWVLNIVLGWSFLGWVAALVWASQIQAVTRQQPWILKGSKQATH
ncbi:superinfection immunity protein [Leclercia adecarboxylata]